MGLEEIVTETKEIFSGKIVKLRVDTVRLPDGGVSKREIVEHHGAVCIVAVTDDNAILMVRQFRLAAGKILLEIPAGTLEVGEGPLACAARELEEETGYKATELRPMFSAYLAPGYSTELIHAFLATGLVKQTSPLHQDSDEHVELEAIPISKVEAMILKGELQDSKSIASVLTAVRLL